MALANKVSAYDRIEDGSAAHSLPQAERAPRAEARPAPARKRSLRPLIFVCSVGWVCVMGFSLMLVHQNTLALEEAARITALRGELATIKQENQDIEKRIEWAQSVEAVENWAQEKGMTRQIAVRSLEGNPGVITTVSQPAAPAPPPAPPAKSGFWGALTSLFSSAKSAR